MDGLYLFLSVIYTLSGWLVIDTRYMNQERMYLSIAFIDGFVFAVVLLGKTTEEYPPVYKTNIS
jgi:hypothetical protein